MKKLALISIAAGVVYVLVTHLRNRGKDPVGSPNGSLGGEARRAVGEATERIGA